MTKSKVQGSQGGEVFRRSSASITVPRIRLLLLLPLVLVPCNALYPSKRLTIHRDLQTWKNARSFCAHLGGRLATFQSPEEWQFLLLADRNERELFAFNDSVPGFWFGLFSQRENPVCPTTSGRFWVDCTPLQMTWDSLSVTYDVSTNSSDKHLDGCFALSLQTREWKLQQCGLSNPFVCEYANGHCDVTNPSNGCHDNATDAIFVVDSPGCGALCEQARADNRSCFQASLSQFLHSSLPLATEPHCSVQEELCYAFLNNSCYSVESYARTSSNMEKTQEEISCELANKTLTQTMTRYVLYNESTTWDDAKAYCDVIGGSLASLHSDYVINMVDTVAGSVSYWVGLEIQCQLSGCQYSWQDGDSTPPSPPLPSVQTSMTQTTYCASRQGTWAASVCSQLEVFVCQLQCGRCMYDVQENITCQFPANQTRFYYGVNSDNCRALCDVETQSGLPCVAFEHQAAPQECRLIFNASEARPFTCHEIRPGNSTLSVKNCFQAQWHAESATLVGVTEFTNSLDATATLDLSASSSLTSQSAFVSDPAMSATPPITNSSLGEMTASSSSLDVVVTSDLNATPHMTSFPQSSSAQSPQSAYVTTMSSATATLLMSSHPDDVINESAATYSTDVTDAATATVDVEASASTTRESWTGASVDNSRCACPCVSGIPHPSPADISDWLRVNKSELSATRRRLRSEPDIRPLATGLGAMGIFFLVCFFASFLLLDLLSLPRLAGARR